MDFGARLRRIERVIGATPPTENIVILYDAAEAAAYQPQPNDFVITVEYGEELHGNDTPNKSH